MRNAALLVSLISVASSGRLRLHPQMEMNKPSGENEMSSRSLSFAALTATFLAGSAAFALAQSSSTLGTGGTSAGGGMSSSSVGTGGSSAGGSGSGSAAALRPRGG